MQIPTGMPMPTLPEWDLVPRLIPKALGIAIVVMAVHVSLAKMFAKKLAYKVDPGQEMYALGLASSLSAFFPVYPVSCSLGRTLVNVEAGTKTQLSAIFSSILLLGIILHLGSYLRTLPMVGWGVSRWGRVCVFEGGQLQGGPKKFTLAIFTGMAANFKICKSTYLYPLHPYLSSTATT